MSILRKTLAAKVRYVIDISRQLGELEHAGTKGRWRELFLSELIEPILPNGVSATTGVLIDSKGTQSKQLDIIIYSSDLLPPILRSNEQSLIPVDAAIQVIEVKSRLDADEMRDCINKAESVKSLFLLGAGNEYPQPFNSILKPELMHPLRVATIFSVFAFKTDLSVKTEWERYRELVKSENMSPSQVYINDICVAGYGYWNSLCDESVMADEDYSEVLSMLVPLINSIPLWKKIRGTPQFGEYFTG